MEKWSAKTKQIICAEMQIKESNKLLSIPKFMEK
jgi:hypothetical protein